MRVWWSVTALSDLDEIQDFVALDSPAAAYKLTSSLLDRANMLLGSNPLAGRQGRVQGTRELVISRTHYIAVYRVQNDVQIVAVVHGAQDWPDSFN